MNSSDEEMTNGIDIPEPTLQETELQLSRHMNFLTVCPAKTSAASHDETKCKICNKKYTNPRLLACLHSFCEACITKCLLNGSEDVNVIEIDQSVECPECNHITPIGAKGAASLPYDYTLEHTASTAAPQISAVCCWNCKPGDAVASCSNCATVLCPACATSHKNLFMFAKHKVVSLKDLENSTDLVAPIRKPITCDWHPSQVTKLFCQTCQKLICTECIVTFHKAPKHKYDNIPESVKKPKSEIVSLLQENKMQADFCATTCARMASAVCELETKRETAKNQLLKTYQSYKAVLKQLKDKALKEIISLHAKQENNLMETYRVVEKSMDQLDRGRKFTSTLLEKGNASELLALAPVLVPHLKRLRSTVPKPEINVNLEFVSDTDRFKNAVEPIFGFFKHPDYKPPLSSTTSEEQLMPLSTVTESVTESVLKSVTESVPESVPQPPVPQPRISRSPTRNGIKANRNNAVSSSSVESSSKLVSSASADRTNPSSGAPTSLDNLMQLAMLAAWTDKLPSPALRSDDDESNQSCLSDHSDMKLELNDDQLRALIPEIIFGRTINSTASNSLLQLASLKKNDVPASQRNGSKNKDEDKKRRKSFDNSDKNERRSRSGQKSGGDEERAGIRSSPRTDASDEDGRRRKSFDKSAKEERRNRSPQKLIDSDKKRIRSPRKLDVSYEDERRSRLHPKPDGSDQDEERSRPRQKFDDSDDYERIWSSQNFDDTDIDEIESRSRSTFDDCKEDERKSSSRQKFDDRYNNEKRSGSYRKLDDHDEKGRRSESPQKLDDRHSINERRSRRKLDSRDKDERSPRSQKKLDDCDKNEEKSKSSHLDTRSSRSSRKLDRSYDNDEKRSRSGQKLDDSRTDEKRSRSVSKLDDRDFDKSRQTSRRKLDDSHTDKRSKPVVKLEEHDVDKSTRSSKKLDNGNSDEKRSMSVPKLNDRRSGRRRISSRKLDECYVDITRSKSILKPSGTGRNGSRSGQKLDDSDKENISKSVRKSDGGNADQKRSRSVPKLDKSGRDMTKKRRGERLDYNKLVKQKKSDQRLDVKSGNKRSRITGEVTKKKRKKPVSKVSAINKWGCKQCGKAFPTEKQLRSHKVTHSTERPFGCPVCPAKFKRRHTLVAHTLCHTSVKPFKCDICDKPFKCLRDLGVHKVRHTAKCDFICGLCGKGFKEAKCLRRHGRVHLPDKPFVCSVCGDAFKHSHALKTHLTRHSDAKPFSCDTCGATFKTRPCLKSHLLMHGEKNIPCKICGKKFRRNTARNIHIRTMHKWAVKKERDLNFQNRGSVMGPEVSNS